MSAGAHIRMLCLLSTSVWLSSCLENKSVKVEPEYFQGEWLAKGYGCYELNDLVESIKTTHAGECVHAIKTVGDPCIKPGDTTWVYCYNENPEHVLLKGYDRENDVFVYDTAAIDFIDENSFEVTIESVGVAMRYERMARSKESTAF